MRRPALLRALRGGSLLVSLAAPACLDRPVVGIVPSSSTITVTPLVVNRPDKIDLLFVVDNSSSMKDKQSELGRRVPALIDAFTRPGGAHPIADVHVGVITTSLGSFGTTQCKSGKGPLDDQAHLMPRPDHPAGGTGYRFNRATGEPVALTCPDPQPGKAISWTRDAGKGARFSGDAGAEALQAAASCAVESAGQDGCGYEQTWEAVYRFLADPAPAKTIGPSCDAGGTCSGGSTKSEALDTELLAQRAEFLRKDSLLAVVVLTDENDFSVRDDAGYWKIFAYNPGSAPPGSAGCANVPDDFEVRSDADFKTLADTYRCTSCFRDGTQAHCKTRWARADGDADSLDARHWNQVQRFGYDFLFARSRYVDAFSARKGNRLFETRSPDQLVVAGIVGVPSFLVADASGRPKALDAAAWKKLVSPVLTERDPHMIESLAPRPGLVRYAGDRKIDPVHGGEHAARPDDLQWACLAPRDKDAPAVSCSGDSPTCTGGLQTHFRAYPGVRHLRILQSLGENAVVASICSASYAPVVDGIVEKIQGALDHQCVRNEMTADETGAVTCAIFESFADDKAARCEDLGPGYCTPGSAACRAEDSWLPPLDPDKMAALLTLGVRAKDASGAIVTEDATAFAEGNRVLVTGKDGQRHLVCEVRQLTADRVGAAAAASCRDDLSWSKESGFCYSTSPAVVGSCKATGAAGTVRFVGGAEPHTGSQVFTMCRR